MVMSALCFCFLFRQCGQCQGRRSDQARISASETQVVASSKYFVKILYREPFSVTVSQQLPVGLPAPLLVKRTSRSFRPKTDAAMADVVTIRGTASEADVPAPDHLPSCYQLGQEHNVPEKEEELQNAD